MSRATIIRLLVVVWAVLCVRAGFTSWSDRGVPATLRAPASATAPATLVGGELDYRCVAPMRSDRPAHLVTEHVDVVSTVREPCSSLRTGRQVLVYLDVAVALVVLAATFAGIRHRVSARFAPAR